MCRRTATEDPLRQPTSASQYEAPRQIAGKLFTKKYVCVFCTLRISRSSAGVMSPIHVVASTNEDLLQDPHLRIHVSTSSCLRLLCKIHVSGFMSQHPCVSQGPLQDPCCRIHSSAAICISGSSTRSTSSDSCLSIFVSHGFSARSTSTSPDSCLSIFISQDPLQVPFRRIRVSDSCLSIQMYLRNLCKIHVPGYVSQDPLQDPCLRFMSQHLYTSGSLQDPCLRIHVSASSNLRLLCKIHVSGSVYKHPEVGNSQGPLQDLSPDSCLSIHMYLRNLCKIHVSGSVYKHPYVSQDPLRDPCLRIHVAASTCISGTSARSMSPDPYVSQDPLQDPCLRIHVSASSNLRILCKIHVSDSCLSIHVSASIYISGSSARSMSPESQHLRISGFSTRSMSSDSCLSIR